MSNSPLDYHTPLRRRAPGNIARANALAVWSLACPCVPAAGFMFQIGPMFLCGGAIAPLVGIALAITGIFCDRRATAICCVAMGMNALVIAYFGWLIFVRGLC